MTWNIYVIGNIKAFFSVFTMLQMLFDPTNNTAWASSTSAWGGPLIGLMLILSLIILVITSLMQGRFLIHHIMIMAIAYAVLFGVTTTVNIQNIYNGQSQIVSGIPIGVAVPASIFSDAFWAITKEVGTADNSVTTDNTNMFSGSSSSNKVYGFDGPLALMYRLRGLYTTFSMSDPEFSRSIANYVDFCMASDTALVDSMGKRKNLASSLFKTTNLPNPNATDMIYVSDSGAALGQPTAVSCSVAAATLSSAWTNFQTGSMASGSRNLSQLLGTHIAARDVPSVSASQANTLLDDVFLNSGNAGYDFMNNMILNCAVEAGANENYDWDSNTPGLMSSYCATKATAFGRSVTVNAANASMFEMNMIPMMAILQFLFFAGFPIIIVVALAMGPNGFGKIGAFLAFGATTMAWMPISAIISNYAQTEMHGFMTHFIANLNNGPATAAINIPNLLEHAMRTQAMADKMLALTPVVTMVLLGLGGAYAATRLAQDQSEESSASKAIGETTPMPGTDTLSQAASGVQVNSTGVAYAGGGSQEMGYTNPVLGAMSVGLGSSAAAGWSAQEARVAEATQQVQTSAALQGTKLASVMQSASTSEGSSIVQSTGGMAEFNKLSQASNTLESALGVSSDKAMAFITAFNAAAGADFAAGGAAWLESKAGQSAITGAMKAANISAGLKGEEAAKITNALKQSNTKKAMDTVSSSTAAKFVQSLTASSTDSALASQAESYGQTASQTQQDMRSLSAARKQQNSFAKTAQMMNSLGGNATLNMGAMKGAMAQFDTSHAGKTDAINASRDNANIAGLGNKWESYFSSASKGGATPFAAASAANLMTARYALSQGDPNAGEFVNGLTRKFGHGVLSTGSGSVTQQAAHREAAAGQMPGQGQSVEQGVDANVAPPNADSAAAGANATFGTAHGDVGGFNPNQDDNTGAASQFYKDHEMAAEGFSPAAVKAWNKAHQGGKQKVDDNPLMGLDNWAAKHPDAAIAVGAVGAAAGGAVMTAGGKKLAGHLAKKAQAAKDAKNAPRETNAQDWENHAKNAPRETTEEDWAKAHPQAAKELRSYENAVDGDSTGNLMPGDTPVPESDVPGASPAETVVEDAANLAGDIPGD